MKEGILTIINIILIFFGILIILSFASDLISRAYIYDDKVDAQKMELCLEKGVDFKSCYFGIYSQYSNFERAK